MQQQQLMQILAQQAQQAQQNVRGSTGSPTGGQGQPQGISPTGTNPQDVRRKFARGRLRNSMIDMGQPQQQVRKPVPLPRRGTTPPPPLHGRGIVSGDNFKGAY